MSNKSNSDDEQHEDIEDSHSSSEGKESLGDAFGGFEPSTRLHYRVESDPEGGSELIPDIASGSRTEDLLERSIQEVDETWQDLESIADRLGDLSPLRTEDAEWELAFFNKQKSDTSQGATGVSRDSLVRERISFFNCRAETTTTMVTTTTTTLTTTTTTTTVAGAPIMTANTSIGSDPYGLNYSRHQ